jgi:hypothetical protein
VIDNMPLLRDMLAKGDSSQAEPDTRRVSDAALDAMITHNAYANAASCIAFVKMLWALLDMTAPPQPSWWIDEFCIRSREPFSDISRDYQDEQGWH